MPEEGVHGDEIHVIMSFGQIAIGVQRGFIARKIGALVGGGNYFGNGIFILLAGETLEMFRRAVVPAQFVARVTTAPAEQTRAPRYGPVHERFLPVIPNR